jgi:serine phosphatase RsbU (regulator of sigma subunit)
MLDLNKFSPSTKPPAIFLKQLDINEQFIDYSNISDSLKNEIYFDSVVRFENYPLNLELPFDKNHLTFHFVAIDWSAPHKIQYSYRMLGLDNSWSNPSKEAKAEYRNLSYGTYTFQIRAIGESVKWSEPFEYTFTINPPWWHTWWFRMLCVLLALILILILIKWRTAALIKRQKELEKTVEERTEELVQKNIVVEQQKHLVEEKHKEITDSINYAERIQRSFLASREMLDANLGVTSSIPQQRDVSRSEPGYFVFFNPKDVVSGDFYWAASTGSATNRKFAFCCADSTGHGVPGAIMSILNISSLEKAIETATEPHLILNKTRELIIERLKKDGSPEGGKDGMDCSLLVLNHDKTELTFASANNPVFIVRSVTSSGSPEAAVSRSETHELLEFRPDKMPVGKHDKDQEPFTLQTVSLQKGDVIYTLTDGFPDQFGGEKGKKYMIKNLKNLFLSIAHLPMGEQYTKLEEEFTIWKGENEQVDDVCIIGVRI